MEDTCKGCVGIGGLINFHDIDVGQLADDNRNRNVNIPLHATWVGSNKANRNSVH